MVDSFDRLRILQAIRQYEAFIRKFDVAERPAFKESLIADRAFRERSKGKSRAVALSQFLNAKLARGSREPLDAAVINDVFAALRDIAGKATVSLGNGIDPAVREFEARLVRDLRLRADVQTPLNARHFVCAVDDRTTSLRQHDVETFRSFVEDFQTRWERNPRPAIDFLACEYSATALHRRPDDALFCGCKVLCDSITHDNVDWKPVSDRQDLLRRPIQATYCTRVVRVDVLQPSIRSVTLEFNTGGFGIIPILDSRTAPIVSFQKKTHMDEVGNVSRVAQTLYLTYPLRAGRGRRREVELMAAVVFFNGVQDQLHERDPDGALVAFDWHGKRVINGCVESDLAVILPESPAIKEARFVRRGERRDRDVVEPVDLASRIFQPAPLRWGDSAVEATKAIWKLPADHAEPTIFSFQWCWETSPR